MRSRLTHARSNILPGPQGQLLHPHSSSIIQYAGQTISSRMHSLEKLVIPPLKDGPRAKLGKAILPIPVLNMVKAGCGLYLGGLFSALLALIDRKTWFVRHISSVA